MLSAKQLVILGMRSNPEPNEAVGRLCGERAVAGTDASRPVWADFLELKRRVAVVFLEMFVGSICNLPDFRRQRLVASPEVWVRVMLQSGLVLPAA